MGTSLFRNLFRKIFTAIKTDSLSDAVSSIDKLIKQNPSNPSHYIKKGDIYQRIGRNDEATVAYQKAAELFKKEGFLRKSLAMYKIILRIDPASTIATDNAEKIMLELQSMDKLVLQPPSYITEMQSEQPKEEVAAIQAEKADLSDISHNEFFLPFTNNEIKEIFNSAELKDYSDGEMVIREGDSGDSIYVIKEGTTKVISSILGKNIELATLRKGDIFGEVAFLTGRPRTASVIANGHIAVYELNRSLLENMIEQKPEILEYLNEIYHLRTKETENKIKNE